MPRPPQTLLLVGLLALADTDQTGLPTLAGAAGGAVLGAAVGAVLPAGPRWVRAAAARPVRVAGLALRPGARVAPGRGRP